MSRVDGWEKVTGAARYTAEISLPQISYAALVGASVPSGRIVSIDSAAESVGNRVRVRIPVEECVAMAAPP